MLRGLRPPHVTGVRTADGEDLTDYDVIGSAADTTGMFALQAVPTFNLLCIPPLAREYDVGLSTLLVAAKFCSIRWF